MWKRTNTCKTTSQHYASLQALQYTIHMCVRVCPYIFLIRWSLTSCRTEFCHCSPGAGGWPTIVGSTVHTEREVNHDCSNCKYSSNCVSSIKFIVQMYPFHTHTHTLTILHHRGGRCWSCKASSHRSAHSIHPSPAYSLCKGCRLYDPLHWHADGAVLLATALPVLDDLP